MRISRLKPCLTRCDVNDWSLSRRDRQGSQRGRRRRARGPESIEEGPAGFPTSCSLHGDGLGVYRGGTGRVPNGAQRLNRAGWSLSRRDRQGSQHTDHVCEELSESIEEGPAGFPTRMSRRGRRSGVYRGGTGRVPNRPGDGGLASGVYRGGTGRVPNIIASSASNERSLSRRDRQGSQRSVSGLEAIKESIEEGPAGFPTDSGAAAVVAGVYRGGTGRVPNPVCGWGRRGRSLSRRDRQGSQRPNIDLARAQESIEEGPAGFPTRRGGLPPPPGVYRGGTGRVPNLRAGDVDLERSLSRRDRQGSQRTEHAGTALGESIEEGPAGFPTEVPRWRLLTGVYRGGTGRVPN